MTLEGRQIEEAIDNEDSRGCRVFVEVVVGAEVVRRKGIDVGVGVGVDVPGGGGRLTGCWLTACLVVQCSS